MLMVQLLFLIVLMVSGSEQGENKETKGNYQGLGSYSMPVLEISEKSKEKFAAYLATLCLFDLDDKTYIQYYKAWENYDFLEGLKNHFQEDDNDTDDVSSYFTHTHPNLPDRCSSIGKPRDKVEYWNNKERLFNEHMKKAQLEPQWADVYL